MDTFSVKMPPDKNLQPNSFKIVLSRRIAAKIQGYVKYLRHRNVAPFHFSKTNGSYHQGRILGKFGSSNSHPLAQLTTITFK